MNKSFALRKLLLTFYFLIWSLLFHLKVSSQALRQSISIPYVSLGAYSTKQLDPFSFTGNQAALAKTSIGGIAVFGERRFLLAENSVYGLAAAVPTKFGNFGIQVNYAGFVNFNEQKAGLAYGRSLGNKIDIGIQFNYYNYKIPSYQNAASINFEAGAIVHFSDKLNAGIHVYNPVIGTLGKTNEKLAAVYKFGLGYGAYIKIFGSIIP